MLLLVLLSKPKFSFISHWCHFCDTRVALVSHLCCTRVARVAFKSLVSGTRVVN